MISLLLLVLSVWIILRQLYWWQVKEYRFDRWYTWIKYNNGLRDIFKLDIRIPTITSRVILIIIITAPSVIFGGFFSPITGILGLFTGLVISSVVTRLQTNIIMLKAKKLVNQFKPTIVVVNGSYGKSSTKDFIVQILKNKYSIAHTKGSENSELGIANRIINDLKSHSQILVLEMGAYKRGEIEKLCRMATPNIVVLTGIGPQHIDLFGSLDNSRLAEFESILSLPKDGKAFLNKDSVELAPITRWTKERNICYEEYSTRGKVTNVSNSGFYLDGLYVSIRGPHFAENILGAICVAKHLKMSKKEISEAVSKLSQPPRSFVIGFSTNGVKLIDNSYNTNKEGFIASLKYLNLYPGDKYVATPGIIELGPHTENVHLEIGKHLKRFKGVFVTRPGVEKYFLSSGANVLPIESVDLKKGDTVLIEGRVSNEFKRKLYSI